MKRNENRKNRNWRNFVVLTLVCMLAATLVGCKTSTAVTPEPSTSEVVSEPVSEPVSEEVSEPVSEEPSEEVISEEVSEEVSNEVEYVNFSDYMELSEYLKKYDKTIIVQYNFGEEGSPQAIIPNGGYYTITEEEIIAIIPNKEVSNVQSNVNFVVIEPGIEGWIIYFHTTGTDLETSFTVNYADGTSEDFTIYVTVE